MKQSITISLICLAVGLLPLSCTDVQVVNPGSPSGQAPSSDLGRIVGRVVPAASGALVIVEQAAPVDSTTILSGDGSFALEQVGPGTYDVVVRADNHRIERLEQIAVYAGSTSYVGTIVLSTTPDQVRSAAPADRSEVVMTSQDSRLAIGIDFVVPMDRASVEAAFSTDPPTLGGVFYWSQNPPANPQDHTGEGRHDSAPPGYAEVPPGGTITTYKNIRSLRYVPRQRHTYVDTTYVVTLATSAHARRAIGCASGCGSPSGRSSRAPP